MPTLQLNSNTTTSDSQSPSSKSSSTATQSHSQSSSSQMSTGSKSEQNERTHPQSHQSQNHLQPHLSEKDYGDSKSPTMAGLKAAVNDMNLAELDSEIDRLCADASDSPGPKRRPAPIPEAAEEHSSEERDKEKTAKENSDKDLTSKDGTAGEGATGRAAGASMASRKASLLVASAVQKHSRSSILRSPEPAKPSATSISLQQLVDFLAGPHILLASIKKKWKAHTFRLDVATHDRLRPLWAWQPVDTRTPQIDDMEAQAQDVDDVFPPRSVSTPRLRTESDKDSKDKSGQSRRASFRRPSRIGSLFNLTLADMPGGYIEVCSVQKMARNKARTALLISLDNAATAGPYMKDGLLEFRTEDNDLINMLYAAFTLYWTVLAFLRCGGREEDCSIGELISTTNPNALPLLQQLVAYLEEHPPAINSS
eukprot:TRINITY_DN1945_c0_g1::TRINITY_DN1945_c0_g1_i1::g.23158::m.23158 TRINITY_DN1945_c0_g1::TRINITY_DN1945_c0_g1_i1::g.23158  ORF type:complete len:425 (+),score=65.37,Alpha_GJ/PF03229.8/5.1e+02,Alpha_GJ/PF03229.8/1.8e+03,Alpha_GJ/PF03229.8/0.24 TRINITY_DN1945_c0_g1_i1:553-1827(+)